VILYSARDITEVVQAKNEADAANMEKSEMLAVLAHEIRTPLVRGHG
jgi:signal transduction histidine kinase